MRAAGRSSRPVSKRSKAGPWGRVGKTAGTAAAARRCLPGLPGRGRAGCRCCRCPCRSPYRLPTGRRSTRPKGSSACCRRKSVCRHCCCPYRPWQCSRCREYPKRTICACLADMETATIESLSKRKVVGSRAKGPPAPQDVGKRVRAAAPPGARRTEVRTRRPFSSGRTCPRGERCRPRPDSCRSGPRSVPAGSCPGSPARAPRRGRYRSTRSR